MNIGTTIRGLRKKRGYTQVAFSELIGISQTSLSKIETGVSLPHKTTMKEICEKLGAPEPLLIILSVEKSDVAPDKQEMYDLLYPTVKDFMIKIFYVD